MANKIQIRRDTTANWTATNIVLSQGELGLDTTLNQIKIGNGTSHWSDLSFYTGNASQLVNGLHTVSLNSSGVVTFPEVENTQLSIAGSEIIGVDTNAVAISSNSSVVINTYNPALNAWQFSNTGTLTVPSPTASQFTITFNPVHYVSSQGKPTLTLTETPWVLHGLYQYNANGEVELQLDSAWPALTNPGYTSGDTFAFGADIHGVVGYTLTITLNDVVLAGEAGWTANVAASQPPAYPSTFQTNGAIKFTTGQDRSVIVDTNGGLHVSSAIRQGVAQLDLNDSDQGNIYLTPSANDTSGLYMQHNGFTVLYGDSVELVAGGQILQRDYNYNSSRDALQVMFDALSGEEGYPWGITQPLAGPVRTALTAISNVHNFSSTILDQAQLVEGAWSTLQSSLLNEYVGISVNTYEWKFGTNGTLTVPGSIVSNDNALLLAAIDTATNTGASFELQDTGTAFIRTTTETTQFQWYFKNDGTIEFPILPTNQRTGTAEALVFTKDESQKVIATAQGTLTGPTVERLVIAGGDGYRDPDTNEYPQNTEGGDIYLWAGRGADGGDIKIDAGNSYGTHGELGGDIKIRGGYSQSGNGGFVQIYAGQSSATTGGYIDIAAGYGDVTGGDLTLAAGYGGTTSGNVYVNTTAHQWQFSHTGDLHLPAGGLVKNSDGSTYGSSTGGVTFSGVNVYGANNSLILRANTTDTAYGIEIFDSADNDTHLRPVDVTKGIALGFPYGSNKAHVRVEGSNGQNNTPNTGDKVAIYAGRSQIDHKYTAGWDFIVDDVMAGWGNQKSFGYEFDLYVDSEIEFYTFLLAQPANANVIVTYTLDASSDQLTFVSTIQQAFEWIGGQVDGSGRRRMSGGITPGDVPTGVKHIVYINFPNYSAARSAEWHFNNDGTFVFPDSTIQTTAFLKTNVPTHSTGSIGDIAGMVAFDANYFYYCTNTYVNHIIASVTVNNIRGPAQNAGYSNNGGGMGTMVGFDGPISGLVSGQTFTHNAVQYTIQDVSNTANQYAYIIFTPQMDGPTTAGITAGTVFDIGDGTPQTDIWKRTAHGTGTW